jgi:hypothetical protein
VLLKSSRWLIRESSFSFIPLLIVMILLYPDDQVSWANVSNGVDGPWEEFPRSMPHLRYEEDEASSSNHHFGVGKAFSPYVDPDFKAAQALPDPLANPEFSSYNLILIVNKLDDPFWGVHQTLRIYKRGRGLLYYWSISTGIKGFETPAGYYRPTMFSSRHWSSIYQVPMLWAVFFHGGMAIHSSLDRDSLRELGKGPSSHGCVHVEDYRAEELFHLVGHSGFGSVDAINPRMGHKTGKKVQSYKTLIIISPVKKWLPSNDLEYPGHAAQHGLKIAPQTSRLRPTAKTKSQFLPSKVTRSHSKKSHTSTLEKDTR